MVFLFPMVLLPEISPPPTKNKSVHLYNIVKALQASKWGYFLHPQNNVSEQGLTAWGKTIVLLSVQVRCWHAPRCAWVLSAYGIDVDHAPSSVTELWSHLHRHGNASRTWGQLYKDHSCKLYLLASVLGYLRFNFCLSFCAIVDSAYHSLFILLLFLLCFYFDGVWVALFFHKRGCTACAKT